MDAFTRRFRRRLQAVGLSDPAIQAAWPEWWSDAATDSRSAQDELRFSVARNLGLDPRSLLDDDSEPEFVWKDEARFKRLTAETSRDQAAIASFGMSVARMLTLACQAGPCPRFGAAEVRESILAGAAVVDLMGLLSLCWAIGIPVVHLRVFPLEAKRMHAMALRNGDRFVILVARDEMYPPWIAHHIAHELGHIMLGHLDAAPVLVDMHESVPGDTDDEQEREANAYALELLTGDPDVSVHGTGAKATTRGLAKSAIESSGELHIEPGTLALGYGYSSSDWRTANGALSHIYGPDGPRASDVVNGVARSQLDFNLLPSDARRFVADVLGDRG